MSSNAIDQLTSRVTPKTPPGASKRLGIMGAAFHELREFDDRTRARPDLSPLGAAAAVNGYVEKFTAPMLAKARRAHAMQVASVEKLKSNLQKKAIGQHDPLDAERRTVLRGLDTGARVQRILKEPAMRLAALRAPDLADAPADVIARALEIAIGENAPTEAATLANEEDGLELTGAALESLGREVATTLRISSRPAFEAYMDQKYPAPIGRGIADEEREFEAQNAG